MTTVAVISKYPQEQFYCLTIPSAPGILLEIWNLFISPYRLLLVPQFHSLLFTYYLSIIINLFVICRLLRDGLSYLTILLSRLVSVLQLTSSSSYFHIFTYNSYVRKFPISLPHYPHPVSDISKVDVLEINDNIICSMFNNDIFITCTIHVAESDRKN